MSRAREKNIGSDRGILELADRVQTSARAGSLLKAVLECEPGSRSGTKNQTWNHGRGAVSKIAELVILEFAGVREAYEQVTGEQPGDRATKATKTKHNTRVRSCQRCVEQIRERFRVIESERISAAPSVQAIVSAEGDLPTQMTLVWSLLMSKMAPHIAGIDDIGQLDNKDRHVIQRFMEGATDAAKVYADIRKTEAAVDQIRAKLELLLGNKKGKDEVTTDDILGQFEEVFGIRLRPAGGAA